MIDQYDKSTGDLLQLKRKRGRPKKDNKPSNTEKTIYRRAKITALIETGTPALWSATICAQIMGMKKYENFHELAWRRYGELLEQIKTNSLLIDNCKE